ncbi:hypothetical protein [Nonomuraea jiangxiensis]|uniref:YXWGXW repeat-containing protein n=1 Tax=Nonomuraea jiangxiensis TaxID=633440 RepID=A0A1G9QA51_9ACTN|nr:hypothetical protein [Nonomuraea jiangxiensis]SDM07813.1 hypothetical protein SAMN05421869_135103 [Nonomuraea jiangxiensis]
MRPLSTTMKAVLIGPAVIIGTLAGLASAASATTTSAHHSVQADSSFSHDPRWDRHQGNRYDPHWGYWRHDPRRGYWHFDPRIGRYRWDPHWNRRWDHQWDHRWGRHHR